MGGGKKRTKMGIYRVFCSDTGWLGADGIEQGGKSQLSAFSGISKNE